MNTETSTSNSTLNNKQQQFAAVLQAVLEDAGKHGNAPTNGENLAKGMDLIRDLYEQYEPTEETIDLLYGLAEVLFYRYSEFGDAYVAVAQALAKLDEEQQ